MSWVSEKRIKTQRLCLFVIVDLFRFWERARKVDSSLSHHTFQLHDSILFSHVFLCIVWPCSVPARHPVSSRTSCKLENTSSQERTAVCLRKTASKFFLYSTAPDTDNPLIFFTIRFINPLQLASSPCYRPFSVWSH